MWTGSGTAGRSNNVWGRSHQTGIVLILYVACALVMIGMAGLALDLGLVYLTKTRLQNAVDAAAMDGAKTLANGQSATTAIANASGTFTLNTANVSGATAVVDTSVTYSPWVSSLVGAQFVKVTVTDVPVTTYLINVFTSGTSMPVAATAIAGPQSLGPPDKICGLPVGLCAIDPASVDTDCTDFNGCYGLSAGEIEVKGGSFSPGNYGLLTMDSGPGISNINDSLAGKEQKCYTVGTSANTQTGGAASNAKAINSRFGTGGNPYDDQSEYPSDTETTSELYPLYQLGLLGTPDNSAGQAGRRKVALPILNCNGCGPGSTCVAPILATACGLLTQPSPTTGTASGNLYIQLIDKCLATGGTPGGGGGGGSGGAIRIVLYQAGVQS